MSYTAPGTCQWAYLGCMGYQEAWDLQRVLAEERVQECRGDVLLLLEHPPTYTLGRSSKEADLLPGRDALLAMGATVVDVDRGGQVTYHGPGQLVGYPVLQLRSWGGPVRYVRALEEVLIRSLAEFGVAAGRQEGLTGVWVDGAKIAAIGVKISRGVTTHGFALNVATNLSYFRNIVPCGIADRDVTSLERLLGQRVPLEAVAWVVARRFGQEFGFTMEALSRNGLLVASRLTGPGAPAGDSRLCRP